MAAHLVLAFWGVTCLLVAVPGPDWAFVLATGARDRLVLPAVGGLVIGYAMLTAVVAAGVGAVVAGSPGTLTVLTAIGAGYLAYLGISLLRRPGALHAESAPSASAAARLRRGVGVSALNPKGLLVFLAVLPQFTDRHGGWPVAAQLAVLGSVFVVTVGCFYLVLGYSARAVLATKPTAARLMSRVSGAAMIAVGLLLVVDRVS